MLIIHSSDWHLGQRFFGHSLLAEQERFINWLQIVVLSTRAAAIIVAGDIFDLPRPSFAAQTLWARFASFCEREGVHLIATAGNHDGAECLALFSELFRSSRFLHLITDAPQIIRIADGSTAVSVAAAPFLQPEIISDLSDVAGFSARFFEDLAARARAAAPGDFHIGVGHLASVLEPGAWGSAEGFGGGFERGLTPPDDGDFEGRPEELALSSETAKFATNFNSAANPDSAANRATDATKTDSVAKSDSADGAADADGVEVCGVLQSSPDALKFAQHPEDLALSSETAKSAAAAANSDSATHSTAATQPAAVAKSDGVEVCGVLQSSPDALEKRSRPEDLALSSETAKSAANFDSAAHPPADPDAVAFSAAAESPANFCTEEGERPIYIGFSPVVPAARLRMFDYFALGHIHRASGQNPRYSGAPLALSFAEQGGKSLSLLRIDEPPSERARAICERASLEILPVPEFVKLKKILMMKGDKLDFRAFAGSFVEIEAAELSAEERSQIYADARAAGAKITAIKTPAAARANAGAVGVLSDLSELNAELVLREFIAEPSAALLAELAKIEAALRGENAASAEGAEGADSVEVCGVLKSSPDALEKSSRPEDLAPQTSAGQVLARRCTACDGAADVAKSDSTASPDASEKRSRPEDLALSAETANPAADPANPNEIELSR